jgi:DNA polymerase III sliding clamp (beta) subunit (PCNA family)
MIRKSPRYYHHRRPIDENTMNDPFTLLPANLGEITRAAARSASRYSMTGAHVEVNENRYEVAATDGKQLAIVKGEATSDPLSFPEVPELLGLPPAASSAVIPTRDWQEAFRSAPPRGNNSPSSCGAGQVAVHLGAKSSILCTSDGENAPVVIRAENVEGRYPDYRAVLPKKEPKSRVHLDVELLLNLLRVARQFAPTDGTRRITLEVWDEHVPIAIRTGNGHQEFTGLLMPLT